MPFMTVPEAVAAASPINPQIAEDKKVAALWHDIQLGKIDYSKVNSKGRAALQKYLGSSFTGDTAGLNQGPVPGAVTPTGTPQKPKLGGKAERPGLLGAVTETLDETAMAIEDMKSQASKLLMRPQSPLDPLKGLGYLGLAALNIYATPFRYAELEAVGRQGYEGFFTGGMGWDHVLTNLGVPKDKIAAVANGLRMVARPDMIVAEIGAVRALSAAGKLTKSIAEEFGKGGSLAKYAADPTFRMPEEFETAALKGTSEPKPLYTPTAEDASVAYQAAAKGTPKAVRTGDLVRMGGPSVVSQQKALPAPKTRRGVIKEQRLIGTPPPGGSTRSKLLETRPEPTLIPEAVAKGRQIEMTSALRGEKERSIETLWTPVQVMGAPSVTDVTTGLKNVHQASEAYRLTGTPASKSALQYHADRLSEAIARGYEPITQKATDSLTAALKQLNEAEAQVAKNMGAEAQKMKSRLDETVRQLIKTQDRRVLETPSPKEISDGIALAKARERAYRAAHDYLEIEGARIEEIHTEGGTDYLKIAETNYGAYRNIAKIGDCGL